MLESDLRWSLMKNRTTIAGSGKIQRTYAFIVNEPVLCFLDDNCRKKAAGDEETAVSGVQRISSKANTCETRVLWLSGFPLA